MRLDYIYDFQQTCPVERVYGKLTLSYFLKIIITVFCLQVRFYIKRVCLVYKDEALMMALYWIEEVCVVELRLDCLFLFFPKHLLTLQLIWFIICIYVTLFYFSGPYKLPCNNFSWLHFFLMFVFRIIYFVPFLGIVFCL